MAPKRKFPGDSPPRRSTGGKAPRPLRMESEVKAPCDHRLYAKIASSKRKHNGTLSNTFTLQLTQHILKKTLATNDHPTNVAISPLSIDVVLAVLAAGAEGEALAELLGFIGFDTVEDVNAAVSRIWAVVANSDAKNAPDICFANALWLTEEYRVKKSFQESLRTVHRTESRAVDFLNQADEVVAEANSWVTEQSRGLIKHIIDRNSINEYTRMILANALYFKGDWYDTFKPKNTKDEDFHLLNGDELQVPFMHQYYEEFDYGAFDGYQVLRMMYKEAETSKKGKMPNNSFSMYVFLPEEKDGLPDLMDDIKLNSSFFKDEIKLNLQKIDNLSFPKFAFECKFSLRKDLEDMGLKLPFEKLNKDFTGMVDEIPPGDDNLYVDDVVQKCRVETNEEGTTAFVVTYGQLYCGAARRPTPPPPVNFVADHPFMFMIREDFSGAVLFVGTVLNPLST